MKGLFVGLQVEQQIMGQSRSEVIAPDFILEEGKGMNTVPHVWNSHVWTDGYNSVRRARDSSEQQHHLAIPNV